jgi:phosphopantetheinyl transferase
MTNDLENKRQNKVTESENFGLEDSDHIWVWSNFVPTTARAAYEPIVVDTIGSYFFDGEAFGIIHDENGKPFVEIGEEQYIFISLAHSGDKLVLALSLQAEVGVDIEIMRNRPQANRVARRYFGDDEQNQSLVDFYKSWTAREAFIKNIGGKLFSNLSQIKTRKNKWGISLGLGQELSHQAEFFEFGDNYLLAFCRNIHSDKPVRVFEILL